MFHIGIKKVSRPTQKAGKSAIYAASRLSVYYSNSIVASGFMSEFSRTSIMNRSEQSDVYRLKEEGADYLLLTKETGKAPHAFATINAIQKILQSR